jgi:muconolactone D-isomerase
MEFLVDMVTTVPEGTTEETVADTRRREAARTKELTAQYRVLRLWKPPEAPGEWRTLGLFNATDEDELRQTLASMPLHKWMAVTVTPVTPHPSDPGITPGAETTQLPASPSCR